MRALSDFYEFLRNHPDAMVAEIEVALEKKGRLNDASARNAVARSVASYMIQMFTFSFFNRTAQNANSADLLEDVQAATANNGTRAFRLLQLSVLLDSPKPFPRSILGALHRECKNDLIVDRLIKWMVVMRLYMFKTSESDMQWINSELGLDMNMQHSIAYADSARKLLK
jgi:hypothetical protein